MIPTPSTPQPSAEAMAHTPGPWHVTRHGGVFGGIFREYVNGKSQDQIAMVCVVGEGNGGTQEGNAKLIASAPDLLKERDSLRQRLERAEEILRRIAEQKPSRPDYWSACGQCDRNTADAEDYFDAAMSATSAKPGEGEKL